MKKFLSAALIAAFAVGFVNAGTLKAAADVIEKGFVSVTTTANTELQPDIVEINIAVQTEDSKSLQKATEENKLISDKVYSALSSMINKENGDYIKTADFNASPIYVYKNNKRNLEKYSVSNNVIIHTKQIKDAGKMIDKFADMVKDLNGVQSNLSKAMTKLTGRDNVIRQCERLTELGAKNAKQIPEPALPEEIKDTVSV